MALISLYLIFTNREDHILSRKKCIANQFVDHLILHFIYLVGQAIVHITTEPPTTKLVACTVLRHMSTWSC